MIREAAASLNSWSTASSHGPDMVLEGYETHARRVVTKTLGVWKRFCPQTSEDTGSCGADRTIKVKFQVATHLASPGVLLVDETNLGEIFRLWAHDVYLWTGFGTIVGLLARMVMPGKDRAGVLTTILVGFAGALIGAALLSYFWDGYRVTPLSPIGFGAAVAGAFILLLFHRLISGYAFPAEPLSNVPQIVSRREQLVDGGNTSGDPLC
jgi:uncharacterized membrane protein YeaQ/YmgE (transglycosylase-associated protein family)